MSPQMVKDVELAIAVSQQQQQQCEESARVLVSLGLCDFAADQWQLAFAEMKRQTTLRRTLETMRMAVPCPICNEHCDDDVATFGMCYDCFSARHDDTCPACGGAGEFHTKVHPCVPDGAYYGHNKVTCEACDGTGKRCD